MSTGWWATNLEVHLSQGDVIDDVLFAVAKAPAAPLAKASVQGKSGFVVGAWTPDSNGRCDVVATGRRGSALVLTHSCELDKGHNKRVIVCPISTIASLPEDQRPMVLAQ